MNSANEKNKKNTVGNVIIAGVFSFVVSFVFSFGRSFDKTDNVNLSDRGVWTAFAFIFVFCIALCFAAKKLSDIKFLKNLKPASPKTKKTFKLLIIFIPAAIWIISWLACFPGVFSYDSWEEWKMISEGGLSTHHPLIHVLILGGLTEASAQITGSGNLGIAVYVFLQMLLSLFVVRRTFDYISSKSDSLLLYIAALLFYALSPVVNLYVLATTKDTVFAFFELWFLINCLRAFDDKDSRKDTAFLSEMAISLLGTLVFRKNGVYIAVVAMAVLIIFTKDLRKKLLIVFASAMVIYGLYAALPVTVFNVEKTNSAEKLCVPMQQMARVYSLDKGSLSKEEINDICRFIPEEYLKKYIPTTADSVKLGFREEEFSKDKAGFFKIWIKLGVKHPMTYVNAFLVNTVDLWYPLAVNDGYRWLYGNNEDESDYFDYRVAEPGEMIVLIKPLHNFYDFLSKDKKISTNFIFSLTMNPGWYIILWFTIFLRDFVKPGKKNSAFHTALAMSVLTVLAGPMSMVRYVLIFFLIFPLELVILEKDFRN